MSGQVLIPQDMRGEEAHFFPPMEYTCPMSLEFRHYSALTLDCYGTLIDWETGLLGALLPFLHAKGVQEAPEAVLSRYGQLEAAAEHGPFRPYKDVLRTCMDGMAAHYGFHLQAGERDLLVRSIAD